MRYRFIEAEKAQFPIRVLCQVLHVARSGWYRWRQQPMSRRGEENRRLCQQIYDIHQASRRTYGSPRIHRTLQDVGERCGRHRVARLMRHAGIRAKTVRRFKRTTNSQHPYPLAANLLAQNFTAPVRNQRWVSDITYIPTAEGWLYLAVVLDLFSRAVVGWALAERMTGAIVCQALTMALGRRGKVPGLLLHSDRGSQYAATDYQRLLHAHGIICSMSRKGNCYDNAPMESFFGTLKRELVHHETYATRAEAKVSLFEYIEVFYNHQRKHSTSNYQAPFVFEERQAACA